MDSPNKLMYVLGGKDSGGGILNEVWSYNVDTGMCSQKYSC